MQSQGGIEAIPLQDAATVERERSAQTLANQTFDRFGNQMTHSKRQISSWKGEIVHERLQVSQVSDQELIEMIRREINLRQEFEIEDYERLKAERQH